MMRENPNKWPRHWSLVLHKITKDMSSSGLHILLKKQTKQYTCNMYIQIIGQKVIPSTWFQKTKKKLLEMNDHSYNGL